MSLQGFIDHCQAASEALAEWMEIYRHNGSVLYDYADQNQAEADAARQYLNAAATEIDAACKLSESVIQEVSDDVAIAILAVTASAKRNVREFFECWQEYEPALLLAAMRQQKSETNGNASRGDDEVISSREACKLLETGRTTLMRWAENAGVKTVSRGYWHKSDIEFLKRTKGTEAKNTDPKGS